MTTTKIVCTAIYVLFIAATLITVGVSQYIDLNSLIVVIVIGALFAAAAKGEESLVQKFGTGAVRAGWLLSIIGINACSRPSCRVHPAQLELCECQPLFLQSLQAELSPYHAGQISRRRG